MEALSDAKLEAVAYETFYVPRRAARALALAHQPCPVDRLVRKGDHLALDAYAHPDLMWLAELALTPELPVGWIVCHKLDNHDVRLPPTPP